MEGFVFLDVVKKVETIEHARKLLRELLAVTEGLFEWATKNGYEQELALLAMRLKEYPSE